MTAGTNGASMRGAASAVAAKLGPREARLLRALLLGSTRREEVDRVAGASNGPDVVMCLKRATGIEVPCRRVPAIDRDGRPCRPGVYDLTDAGRIVALHFLPDHAQVRGSAEGSK